MIVGADLDNSPDTEEGRRLMHVAMARAVHQLRVACTRGTTLEVETDPKLRLGDIQP